MSGWWILAAAAVAVIVWLLGVAFLAWQTPAPPRRNPHPAASREEALERLAQMQGLDGPEIAPACRTVLLEPKGE
ncbi:MAG: DUF4381 family protein, partial [Actinobacteria bacterium]